MSVVEIDILDAGSEPQARFVDEPAVQAWIKGSTVSFPNSAAKFAALAQWWRAERRGVSSITDMSMHPAYQQILGMGAVALPFIFRDLAVTGDHWFWALKFITGADPVPESDRGKTKKMAQAWLDWGRANGHAD